MDVLKRIEELRKEKGWSMYKLAEESMLTQSTLANMFARKTQPSLSTILNICSGLGITPSRFFAENLSDIETENENILLQNFRALSGKDQLAVINLVNNLNNKN